MRIALHKHYIIGVSQFYFSLKLNGLIPEVWGKYITVEISEEHMAYLKLTAPELMNRPWRVFKNGVDMDVVKYLDQMDDIRDL